MAEVRYENGQVLLDGRFVERRDYGVQLKTDVVGGTTVYLGEVLREVLTVYLPEGKKVQATAEVPYMANESALKLGERMGLERKKVLDNMAGEIAAVLGNKEV